MKPLTYPMKLVLRDIADLPDGAWVYARSFNDNQLNALHRRGLVELRFTPPYHEVRLTDAGREATRTLQGETS